MAFCCLLSLSAISQTPGREDYTIWHGEENTIYFVYAPKAMVRQSPSTAAPLVDSLLVGDKLIGKGMTKTFSTIKGMYAPWMQVEYNTTTGTRGGFVWTGLLGFQSQHKGDTAFIYGLEKVKSTQIEAGFEQTKFTLGLKAVTNNMLLAVKEWTIDGGESSSFVASKKLGSMGLTNVQEVLRINLGGEACGIPTNYYYHGWNGRRFYDLPGKYEVGDAGVFYHTETLLFPSEKGGKAGHIIKLMEEEELVQEETATQKEQFKKTHKKEVYVWNGERAIKIK